LLRTSSRRGLSFSRALGHGPSLASVTSKIFDRRWDSAAGGPGPFGPNRLSSDSSHVDELGNDSPPPGAGRGGVPQVPARPLFAEAPTGKGQVLFRSGLNSWAPFRRGERPGVNTGAGPGCRFIKGTDQKPIGKAARVQVVMSRAEKGSCPTGPRAMNCVVVPWAPRAAALSFDPCDSWDQSSETGSEGEARGSNAVFRKARAPGAPFRRDFSKTENAAIFPG